MQAHKPQEPAAWPQIPHVNHRVQVMYGTQLPQTYHPPLEEANRLEIFDTHYRSEVSSVI